MFNASADVILPTSIIDSPPRPSWFTENLGTRSLLEAMVQGTNMVRAELGLPLANCRAEWQQYSLAAETG